MGKFQPGQTKPKNSGRKKGTPNKKSKDLHEVLKVSNKDIPAMLLELLPKLPETKQADVLLGLMTYLYPKKKQLV